MKIHDLLKDTVDESVREEFERSLLKDNFLRGKILTVVIIVIEAVYTAADVFASALKADNSFKFNQYLAFYLAMIALNAAYLMLIKRFEKELEDSGYRKEHMYAAVVIYITFVMTWGSAVTLMDQRLYGQIVAFIINMITCSVVYILDHRKILVPYSVSVAVLAIALPFV